MTEQSTIRKKAFLFLLWITVLSIPLGVLLLWDSTPRYRAMRQLRTVGVSTSPTSLYKAIDQNDLSTVELLRTAQIPLDTVSDSGQTPLIASIRSRSLEITDYLTEQPGIDCDQPDEAGVSPLAHAIMLGHYDSAERLLPYVQDPNVMIKDCHGQETHALLEATRQRNGRLLRLLLTHPEIDVNVQDARGKTPLHYAIAQDDLLVVRALFSGSRPPDPNLTCLEGETALGIAVDRAQPRAVALLLSRGARPSQDRLNEYLVTAVDHRDPETLKQVLAAGADPNLPHPEQSVSMLHHAMDQSQLGCVLELLEGGAVTTGALRRAIECGQGWSAQIIASYLQKEEKSWVHTEGLLEMAIESGHPECIDLLLRHGTDPNQFSSAGQRVLVMALAARKSRIVKRLLELGADPNLRLKSPASPAFLAHFKGDAKALYYLKLDRDLSPLMLAALTEQEEATRHLIAHGASRNAYTRKYKRYPISFAAERHNIPIMQMILGRKPHDETRKVVISLKDQKAVMYKKGKATTTSRVSTGRRGYRTKPGTYVITNKYRHHKSSIYGSSMPFFMRLSCSDFGLHYSASVPSYPASHGCIRMPWSKAEEFFGAMQVGDVVVIE